MDASNSQDDALVCPYRRESDDKPLCETEEFKTFRLLRECLKGASDDDAVRLILRIFLKDSETGRPWSLRRMEDALKRMPTSKSAISLEFQKTRRELEIMLMLIKENTLQGGKE